MKQVKLPNICEVMELPLRAQATLVANSARKLVPTAEPENSDWEAGLPERTLVCVEEFVRGGLLDGNIFADAEKLSGPISLAAYVALHANAAIFAEAFARNYARTRDSDRAVDAAFDVANYDSIVYVQAPDPYEAACDADSYYSRKAGESTTNAISHCSSIGDTEIVRNFELLASACKEYGWTNATVVAEEIRQKMM